MIHEEHDEIAHLRLVTEIAGIEVPEVVLPEEHDVVVQGMRLHYLDWGTRGARPLLFLHGGALTAHTWDIVCLALRQQYHCLALDQRGHGDSEWSPVVDYSVEAHLRDIEGVVDHLGLDQFILVGMSMGAMNAIAYAARHSDRLAGLVIVDAGPDVRIAGGQRIVDFVAQTAQLDSIDEFVQRAIAFNPRRDPRLLRRSLCHNLRRLPNGKWIRKHDLRLRVDVHEIAARLRTLWEDVARIACPTLVVRGAESDLFLDADAEKLAGVLPDGRWTRVAGAGHSVQGDNPRGLVHALRSFFRDIGL